MPHNPYHSAVRPGEYQRDLDPASVVRPGEMTREGGGFKGRHYGQLVQQKLLELLERTRGVADRFNRGRQMARSAMRPGEFQREATSGVEERDRLEQPARVRVAQLERQLQEAKRALREQQTTARKREELGQKRGTF